MYFCTTKTAPLMKTKLTLLCMIALAVCNMAVAQTDSDRNFEVKKQLDVFNSIYKNLDMMYVDTLDAKEVIGTGIKAMLRSLDPYTEYYPEENMKELKEMYTGKFAGIGAIIRYNSQIKRVVIDEPYQGMPADKAGLKKGDIILAIDDSSMIDKNVSYVSSRLRGDPGTSFILKVERPTTGKKMKIKITRQTVQTPSVPYYGIQASGVGYINLRQFTEDCSKEVRKAFIEMKEKGIKGLVLDLRNNGGGSEAEAVHIVNMFVPKDLLIVSNRGKLKRSNIDYKTKVEPIDTVMPVVVLVNDDTASASEITSGALQDLDRAVILGMRTYGKGLVQISVDLPYNGSLKLTSDKYYIPSGRCIQAINYRHAQGGYTEHIPDSLTKVFHTAHGREVRDGGGIMPDVVVEPDSLPNIGCQGRLRQPGEETPPQHRQRPRLQQEPNQEDSCQRHRGRLLLSGRCHRKQPQGRQADGRGRENHQQSRGILENIGQKRAQTMTKIKKTRLFGTKKHELFCHTSIFS